MSAGWSRPLHLPPPEGGAGVVVFTGQGAQKTGMARDFVEAFPLAAAVFDEASEALDLDLRALCFEPDERLHLTAFTQPAILTAEVAMFAVAQAEWGYRPALFGGHSLGEYAALVAAGVLPLTEAVRLVAARGRLMQEAVPVGVGAMAALIGENLDCAALTAELADLVVDVANHNSPDQVVLSGASADIDLALTRLSGPGRRGKKLVVSAPFHSRLMAPIEPAFADLLRQSAPTWRIEGASRVASNTTGGLHEADVGALIAALTRQISGTVRFVDNMAALPGEPVIEIGPSRVLRAFFQAVGRPAEAVTNLASARRAFQGPTA